MDDQPEEKATISAFLPRKPRPVHPDNRKMSKRQKPNLVLPENDETDPLDSEHNSSKRLEVEEKEQSEHQRAGNLGQIQRSRPLLRENGTGQLSRLASDSMPLSSAAGGFQNNQQRRGLRSKWAETTSKAALTATTTSHLAGKSPLHSIKENRREDSEARHSRHTKPSGSPVERSAPVSFNVSIEDFFEVFMREDPGIRKNRRPRPQSVERDSILITGNRRSSRHSNKVRGARSRLQEMLPMAARQLEPHEGSGSLPDVSRSQHRSNTQRLNKSTDRLDEKSHSKTNNSGSPLPIKLTAHNRSSESHSGESPVGSKQNSSELSGAIKGLHNQVGPSFISQQIRDRLTSNIKFGAIGPKFGLGLLRKPLQQPSDLVNTANAQPADTKHPQDLITIENSVENTEINKKVAIHDASDKFLADTSEVLDTNRTNKTAEHLVNPLAPNPRRFCIIENYMVNTTRPLSKLLVTSIRRFKETIFSCEKDVYDKIGLDPKMIELLAQQAFLQTSGVQRPIYLQHLQSLIETIMNALRHSQGGAQGGAANKLGVVFGNVNNANKSKDAIWSYSRSHPLRKDVVFSLAMKLFNPHTVFLVLVFYMRVLLAADHKEKCLGLGKILLSLAYMLDSELCRVEAYSQLGHYFEKYKEHEKALFCFTRAMQHCWDCKASSSKTSWHGHSNTSSNNTSQVQLTEQSLASLIGVQLYNLNELRLARLYHERMLSGFLEPVDSNAMIRSKEILIHETLIFNDNFLVRPDNYLDKYRVISSLLTLNTPPFDQVLTLERDENDNPMILTFIETVLSSQVMNSELNSAKKTSQTLQLEALLRHKERLFSQKENELSQNIGEVHFTTDGRRVLKDGVEYIQKVTTFLENRSKNQSMRVSHQRDINAIFNFLSSTHNSDSVRVDYEKRRTMALENAKKYSVEDFLVFLTRARYYVIKKINDLQPKKPDRNTRKFARRSILGDATRLRSRTEGT